MLTMQRVLVQGYIKPMSSGACKTSSTDILMTEYLMLAAQHTSLRSCHGSERAEQLHTGPRSQTQR